MAEYAVTFTDSQVNFWEAVDIDDLLTLVAEYYGVKKEIMRRGLVGCRSILEKVEMYNAFARFSEDKIERIREVKERLYG